MLYKYVCIIQNLANFLITPLGNLVNEAVVANGNLLDDWSRAELITHIVQHYHPESSYDLFSLHGSD